METGILEGELKNLKKNNLFFFSPQILDFARANWNAFTGAKPFPHIVIDNLLPPGVLDSVLEEFPKPEEIRWMSYDRRTEKKLASKNEHQLPQNVRHILSQFNSATFCQFLEELTGISGIIPDPYLLGGGLHQIEPGGFLKVHADFNWNERLRLDRRINLLLYLNKNWKAEYGGSLELWETDMSACGKKILPIFNRCVIFNTTSDSYHGHPDPLTCPEGWTRKSLALYYYTNGRPEEEKREFHTTLFKVRPGEKWTSATKDFLKRLLPPVLIDLANVLRRPF
jgi:Rps23 Pro-64 3,4-dihydroxylase Tpa1-like proline 4-hydroxylase